MIYSLNCLISPKLFQIPKADGQGMGGQTTWESRGGDFLQTFLKQRHLLHTDVGVTEEPGGAGA